MKKFITENKASTLFISGLVMLIFAGALWWANGGFMKTEKTKAAWSNCADGGSGCFKETWSATKVLGHVYSWVDDEPYIGIRRGCEIGGYFKEYFAVSGSQSSNNCTNSNLKLPGTIDWSDSFSANIVVTDWTVTGEIQ